MTLATIENAGYIVSDNEAIWGYGATATAAWDDFLNTMKMAGVEVVDEPSDAQLDNGGDWTREAHYKTNSASAALLADVAARGGAIAWRSRNGVCCTVAEYEGEDE